MKKTSFVMFLCLCTAVGFARNELSTNGSGNGTLPVPLVSVLSKPIPQCDRVPAVKGDNRLFAAFTFASTLEASCSDSIANCKDPVKYLGVNGDCACFACEYAESTQHNICTNSKKDKDTLLGRAIH
jgi:hypothetical protein